MYHWKKKLKHNICKQSYEEWYKDSQMEFKLKS
jgi:hypothetical protein